MTQRRQRFEDPGGRRRALRVAVLGIAPFCAAVRAGTGADQPLVLFAAASLHDLLDELLVLWRQESGGHAVVSYAGTSALARQIERGAPADLFIGADQQWMDYLVDRNAVNHNSVINLAANSLVVIVPAGSEPLVPDRIADSQLSLLARLGSRGRLAMAHPQHVPAGRYGKQALRKLALFDGVESRLTRSANVRLALALVARGECPVGVVYASDAHADRNVQVLASFPAGSHDPIAYPAATTRDTVRPDAAKLLAWLASPARAGLLARHGFRRP